MAHSTPQSDNRFHRGEKVHGAYRSATFNGTIEGVIKQGHTAGTTEYKIHPMFRHVSKTGSKESAIIHRYGSKIHSGWVSEGMPKSNIKEHHPKKGEGHHH